MSINESKTDSIENLLNLSDTTVKAILKECTPKQLIYSLNATSSKLVDKIAKNLDEDAFSNILEGIKKLGALKLSEIKNEQSEIVKKMYKHI